FQAASNRVIAAARAKFVLPAEPLLLNGRALGHWANILVRIGRAVGFAERVTAGNERNRLLVIHRHAGERLSDIPCGSDWIWLSIRPFRIHIDQAHLHGSERILKIAVAPVALVRQPLAF